jgi:formylglycine-generating enzyme
VCLLGLPPGAECDDALLADERPARELELRSYFIDRTEVSHAAYLRCVAAGACAPSAASDRDVRIGRAEQPVVQITWHDAQRYCAFVGGALPSEAQWERAARLSVG